MGPFVLLRVLRGLNQARLRPVDIGLHVAETIVEQHDIFGGGVLEECSDIILALHNPSEALVQREPPVSEAREHDKWTLLMEKWRDKVEVAALKRRRGKQSGWKMLRYDGASTTFSEL